MAELRRVAVTDTHPLLMYAAGHAARMGKAARAHFDACERREAIVYVPAVVLWEVALLARRGKVRLGRPIRGFFDDLFSNPAYQTFDLTPEQVYLADERQPNPDPFDGLIVAAARSLELPLITRDDAIERAGLVRTLW